jgi:hypothetical protein
VQAAALGILLVGIRSPEERPPPLPIRDVDITYDLTRPHQPPARMRVRWLAREHLERADATDASATIFDHNRSEITLLTPRSRTYRKLEGQPRSPIQPNEGTVLARGGQSRVAAQPCTEWSWTEDAQTHTACTTPDGVLLRLSIDGEIEAQARSVRYEEQQPQLFQVHPAMNRHLHPKAASSPRSSRLDSRLAARTSPTAKNQSRFCCSDLADGGGSKMPTPC